MSIKLSKKTKYYMGAKFEFSEFAETVRNNDVSEWHAVLSKIVPNGVDFQAYKEAAKNLQILIDSYANYINYKESWAEFLRANPDVYEKLMKTRNYSGLNDIDKDIDYLSGEMQMIIDFKQWLDDHHDAYL